MSPSTAELIRDSLPLVGVVVGGVLGAWLNTTSETRRWRRQWMFATYREQRDYIGQVLAAVEAQFILLHRFGDAARGRGPVTSQERIRVARTTSGGASLPSKERVRSPTCSTR